MKKILLLIPPSSLYPMGAAYVGATLERASLDYDIFGFFYDYRAWFKHNQNRAGVSPVNCLVEEIPARSSRESFFNKIAREKYDYVLVGGLVGFFRWFYELLPQIKGYCPTTKIIMGGGITRDLPENAIFENLDVDIILKGEAETNLIELLAALEDSAHGNHNLLKIPGCCWKDSTGAVRSNPTSRYDLDANPILPAWDSFFIDEYIKLSDSLFHFNKTFFPIMAGRGCPNVCAFCSPSIGKFTPTSVDRVIEEMVFWSSKYEFDFFFIYSEVAFDDEAYSREFCEKYRKALNKPWVGQLRTDVKFSVDTYRLMKKSSCMFICMGFESANDRVLKAMRKSTTYADHMRNLTQAREAGLSVFGNMMFGHDTETAEEIKETFDFVNAHDAISGPFNGLASIIIYPGTGYYKTAERKGLVKDPFKFLLSYSLKVGISAVDIRDKEDASALNISAVATDDYYNLICTENIKHRHIFSKNHEVIHGKRSFVFEDSPGFIYHGECKTCGNELKFGRQDYFSLLNVSNICTRCYYYSILDVFQFEDINEHIALLRKALDAFERVVVYGAPIMDLIFNRAIDFPYNKIVAWVDPANPKVSNLKYVYHLPQIPLDQIRECGHDAILSLRPSWEPISDFCRQYIEKDGVPVIHIAPDILNADLKCELLRSRSAVVGESPRSGLVKNKFQMEGIAFESIPRSGICAKSQKAPEFDFLIIDSGFENDLRREIACSSGYRLDQIIDVTHLLDGGYFA